MGVTAVVAVATDILVVKMAVPLMGAVVITAGPLRASGIVRFWRWWLVVALVASAAGDIFLSNLDDGGDRFFLIGTSFYVVAHLGYVVAMRLRGRFHRASLIVGGAVVGAVAFDGMVPQIDSPAVAALVVVYTIISAVSLSAAVGVGDCHGSRLRVSVAVLCIIVSDIAIGYRLFLGNPFLDPIILPTYFAAHILFTHDARIAWRVRSKGTGNAADYD